MSGRFRQALAATLLLAAAPAAWGCSLCLSAFELEVNTQFLVHAQQAVLAEPDGPQRHRVVAVIKHGPATGAVIADKVTRLGLPPAAADRAAPRLLVRESGWLVWADLGEVDARHADWLRRVASFSRNADLTEAQRAQYVAFFLAALASPEPMVRTMAAAEVASAPYGAVRANRAAIDVTLVRDRLAADEHAKHHGLYWLLLGLAGDAGDGARLDREVERAWQQHDTTDLAARLVALVELQGSAGAAKVQRLYLRDASRTSQERSAAAHALEETGLLPALARRPAPASNPAGPREVTVR